ncbi:conserved hypothetical protein [Anaeromyxobacter dehalogenans 2CP-1]|uniref:MORN repeat protein n=1 Tax=Anaeromyxobacter dehalogenans (strain ATCC BAA-258 / DSM 21875 / 2CP-1) TaxID=455488 RepID=B8JCJ2_ANAD2|nr:hypothetical protein [Anaeromyxobacter dehalogenans]ACL67712.1 conserved hypothetical protein [Anaeromyxobacter dehalogenans 2CP-1]
MTAGLVWALAAALALLAGAPLDCPPGTEPRGAAPPEGFEAWCAGKDAAGNDRREGPARTWYDDGAPWTEGAYREGERDGPFVEYHRNGRRAREGAWAHGAKHGRWTIWYESGQVEETSGWRAGVQDGAFASFWPGGARRAAGRHCGGAQCGRWTSYDEAGRELGAVDYGEQTHTP